MLITSVTKQREYNNMVGIKKEINRGAKSGEILIWNCTAEYVCMCQLNSIHSLINQKNKIKEEPCSKILEMHNHQLCLKN